MRRIVPNFENCSLEEFKAATKNGASNRGACRLQALRLDLALADEASAPQNPPHFRPLPWLTSPRPRIRN